VVVDVAVRVAGMAPGMQLVTAIIESAQSRSPKVPSLGVVF